MGKKGKKAATGKPKKLTPKDIGKRLDALVKKLEEELKGADLFAPLPLTEECPICLVPLSRLPSQSTYAACCGKSICIGCSKKTGKDNKRMIGEECPFCRTPVPSKNEELIRRLKVRASAGDRRACNNLGANVAKGSYGTPKNSLQSLDYLIRALELGSAEACVGIAYAYRTGEMGVSVDPNREALFERVGALRGDIVARHDLGISEYNDFGNHELAICHWKIAAEAGMQLSLNKLRDIFNADGKMPGKEFITKDELDRIYRVCHDAQEAIKSDDREKLASDDWRC